MAKLRRHDADDRDEVGVDHDGRADGPWIRFQAAPPVRVADDRNVGDTRHIVGRREHPPESRLDPEDREIVPRDEHHFDTFKRVAACDVRADGQQPGDAAEQVEPRLIVEELRRRDPGVARAKSAKLAGDTNQLLRPGVLEWPQDYAVDDAEDRGAGADANGQRQHNNGRVAARTQEIADGELNIARDPHGAACYRARPWRWSIRRAIVGTTCTAVWRVAIAFLDR